MSQPTFLLFPFGLTLADAQIGRFVTNPFAPQASYIPENPSVPDNLLSHKAQINAKTYLESVHDLHVKASLTSLFQARHSKSGQEQTTLDSSCIHTTLFRNPGLQPLLAESEATRKWIGGKQKVYLITGIKVFGDAKVSVDRKSTTQTQLKATVPVTALATHGAAAVAGVDTLDVTVEPARSSGASLQSSFEAVGDTIFAVEYRELKYKNIMRRKNLDKASLAYAAAPTGASAIFYGTQDVEGGGLDGQAGDTGDTLQVELGRESFSPMDDDGEYHVEEGDEILILQAG